MLQHVMSITLFAALASATPASSQIRANASIGGGPRAALPRLMVANPTLLTSGDSATAIVIGDGLRERLTRQLSGTFTVISKRDMNQALGTFGFADNELLPAASAMRLAVQIDARVVVTSTIHRGPEGRLQLVTRVASSSGSTDVGHVATTGQTVGQPLVDFGSKAGDAIFPAIKSWNDARSCLDQSTTKPDKAQEAADKAFRTQPGHGLASYCLAEMAARKDSVGAATLTAWQDVVKGDPLSLTAWSQIGFIYQVQKDSSKAVETFQQMLRIAPTNQVLRDASYKLFRDYGRPEAAMQVVDEGIKMDPANTDWYDLKSNICLGQGDFDCAIAALEEVYAVDSTRADTSFYVKMLYAVKAKPDTAKYLLWSKRGAKKYDSRADILEELSIAYGWVGEADSSVSVAQQMIMLDDTKTDALLRVVKSLVDGGRYARAAALAPTVKGLTDPDVKNTYGSILLDGSQAVVRVMPRDNGLLVTLGEAALSVGFTNDNLIVFTNYFMAVGLSAPLSELSTAVRAQKSCDLARQEDTMLAKLEPALKAILNSTNADVANYGKSLLPVVQTERPAVAQMIGQFCK